MCSSKLEPVKWGSSYICICVVAQLFRLFSILKFPPCPALSVLVMKGYLYDYTHQTWCDDSMTKNLVTLDSHACLASYGSCDDSGTENYSSEPHHCFMLLLYSDTEVSSNYYLLCCSLNKDKPVSVTTWRNHNQQILKGNCGQDSVSHEMTACCWARVMSQRTESSAGPLVTASCLTSWSSCLKSKIVFLMSDFVQVLEKTMWSNNHTWP